MSAYTREVAFTATSGIKTLVALPAHMRGALGRLYVKQTSGVLAGYKIKLFDRSGASAVGTDLFCSGGVLTGIADNGSGKCRFTVDSADMLSLRVGNVVEVKGSDVSGYNILTHVVTAIVSTTTFDTDQSYTSAGTGGYWQTAPAVFPTVDPDVHQVIDEVTVAGSASTYSHAYQDLMYQNRDNQSSTARRMTAALYLEILPSGTGDKDFMASCTTQDRLATL